MFTDSETTPVYNNPREDSMAKKAELVNVPVSEQNIDTSIDMKLTKQDLIDMVIEETRERLEAQVQAANEVSCAARAKVSEAVKGASKLFVAAARAKFKKELALIKANGGEAREPSVGEYYGITEYGILGKDDIEMVRTHNTHKPSTKDGRMILHLFEVPSYLEVSNRQNVDLYGYRKNGGCGIRVDLTLSLTKADLSKLYAPLIALVKEFAKAEAEVNELQNQLRNVDKMGKKAKTQLIKRILESSTDGQALLSNMTAIKSNVTQLLLEGTRNA